MLFAASLSNSSGVNILRAVNVIPCGPASKSDNPEGVCSTYWHLDYGESVRPIVLWTEIQTLQAGLLLFKEFLNSSRPLGVAILDKSLCGLLVESNLQ